MSIITGKKILGIGLYLLLITSITEAQPGCPEVNAGNPVTLPCGTTCTTLTAVPFETGATTTYSVSQIAYNPPVSFNVGTVLPVTGDDYWSSVINLPFTFCYFDSAYTSVIVESNGAISFNTANAGNNPASWEINGAAPFAGEDDDLQAAIMCPYQDLDNTYQGTIKYYIGGTAPCRYFVAIWNNLAMYGDSESVATDNNCLEDDHQYQMVVIYETTNVIEMYIQNKDVPCNDAGGGYWNHGWAVEGIQNWDLTTFIGVPGRNATRWSASNDAWRFTPAGPSVVSVGWYNGTTQISTDSFVTVCPATTTTYTAKATYTPCDGGAPVVVSDNVTVTLSGSLNAGVDSSKNVSCFGLANGAIYAHVSGGTPPVNYGWSNGSTSLTLTNLSPGTYIFTADDAASCTRADTVVITQPTQLTATVPNATETNCTGTGTGVLTAQPAGGNVPYTYNWNNGEAGVSDTALTAGNYTVIVTDSLNCTASASATLTINTGASTVTITTLSVTNVTCFGNGNGTIAVIAANGNTPYHYSWSNAQNTDTAVNLQPGPYTVSVTDAGGCTATATFNITQPQQLAITATVQNMACGANATGSINVTATGGTPNYTYNWTELSNGQTFTGADITGLTVADTYTVLVTDANGCKDSASYQITQSPALTYLDSIDPVSCYGGNNGAAKISVTSGTPPYTFSWDYSPATTDSIITNLSEGPVEVIVADSNDCQVQIFLTIPQPQPVSIQLVADSEVSCFGGSNGVIIVSASGGTPGYTYAWSNNEPGTTDTGLTIGAYSVLVTDTNNCTASATYNVSQPTAITINPPRIQDIGCAGGNTGSITANVSNGTPGYTYNWVQEATGQLYSGQTISNLAAGTYFMAVTDANGCPDTTSYSITSIPLLSFSVSAINVSCFNGNNGSAHVSVTSGTEPYLFSFNNGSYGTDSIINTLTAGYLLITVTDSNTCVADTTIVISQPPPLDITLLEPATNVLCNGGNNGKLVVAASGGTPSYSYLWNNQVADSVNANLTAGNYTVIVLDNNDCADTAHYTITQPTALVANPTYKNAICYGGADGSIDANPSGGTSPYSFIWNNGENGEVADNLAQGSYDCTITDANGCSIIFTDTVGQPAQMQIFDSATAVKCIGQKNGTAIVRASGDTPPYTYNVTQDNVNFIYSTNGIVLGLDTGVYIVEVSDSNGCIVDTSVYVPNAKPDGFYAPVADSTLCYGPDYNDGAVLVLDSPAINDPHAPYQYSIDGGALQDTGFFQNLSAGAHTVIAVNVNGCVDTIPVFIPQPLPVEAIVTPDSITLPLGGSQSVLVTYLNATNPSYSWGSPLGFSCANCPNPVISSYASGTYVVTVSMVNGDATCYGSTTLYVNVLGHTKAFIPNVFTPNGDGVDDIFQIYGEDIQTASLKVFNRWGELVYSTTNSMTGWDGTYKGVMQMPGVFTYEASITYLDNSQESKKGTVTLLR